MSDTPLPLAADEEIVLTDGNVHLRVSPYGASLRGFTRGSGEPIVTEYSGADNKVGGQGDVLIPFPGRIGHGTYTFEGQSYQMPINDKEGPNAIHGFLRSAVWDITAQSDIAITFETDIRADEYRERGYPFSIHVALHYRLEAQGFQCAFTMTNVGDAPAPVAAGFHPYFTVLSEHIDSDILHVPFADRLEFNDELVPTGVVLPLAGTDLDFQSSRPIGDVAINTCYLNPTRDADGMARIVFASANGNRKVTVWMDKAFDFAVLYSGDPLPDEHRRKSLAIEPMTCGSDAFNHPEWGLVALQPGAEFSGTWGVVFE